MKIHVKTGDTVMVISGRHGKNGDVGKTGKVVAVSPKEGKVIVEGRNIKQKHVKPRKQGEQGGIIAAEGALHASKVMLVCPKCGKPTRVGHEVSTDSKGNVTKLRKCRRADCGKTFK